MVENWKLIRNLRNSDPELRVRSLGLRTEGRFGLGRMRTERRFGPRTFTDKKGMSQGESRERSESEARSCGTFGFGSGEVQSSSSFSSSCFGFIPTTFGSNRDFGPIRLFSVQEAS